METTSAILLHHYIGGQAVTGRSERHGAVYNPATGEISAQVPLADAEETRTAIAAAQAAFSGSRVAASNTFISVG